MEMSEWAKREVEIACKKENPNWDGKSFDYGCNCYQSALGLYDILCKAGHSDMSFYFTRNILIRLMNGNPLTPITDDDFFAKSSEHIKGKGLKSYIECPRMSSLFRKETLDGKVSYTDADRVICVDKKGNTWNSALARDIIDKMFPITMPYFPSNEKYKIYREDFVLNPNNDYPDHEAFMCVITPKGEIIELDEYYKEIHGEWVKISKEEYFKDKEKLN